MSWPTQSWSASAAHSLATDPAQNPPDGASIEAVVAARLFRLNWLLLAAMLAVMDVTLLLTDFRIRPTGYLVALLIAAIYGACGHANARSHRGRPWISAMLTGIAQIILVVAVMISLTYMAAAANFPLQDARLLAFDRAIGFDFRAFVGFVNDRSWLIAILAWGYRAISWPILVIAVLLPLTGHHLHASKYVLVFLIALIATTLLSIAVPAIGTYGAVGLVPSDYPNFEPQGYYDTLRDLPLIRDGKLRVLDLPSLGGIVTFPSFHAAAAVIYIWALWPVTIVRWLGLLSNGAMLVATPIGGGHFLADVIAGIAVVVLSVAFANWIASRLASEAQRTGNSGAYSEQLNVPNGGFG
jgi:PAP2 superfamily